MGLIGLARPFLWHSSRHSSHMMSDFTEYQMWLMDSPFRNWYTADWDYGLGSIYFFCASIFVFSVINALSMYRSSASKKSASKGVSITDRVAALFRYFSSRQYYIGLFGWYSPPLGPMVIVAAMIIFFMVLTFAVHPYYWPVLAMGNSPPLGTRAGWISMAILPFMLGFSTKFNLIGMLVGTTHEKLQVYHRWTAWIMYITSLVHTFPFIHHNIKYGTMESFYRTKSYYWTGIAALIPQTWLILMSWGPIRSRYYETFKKIHFLASMVFMGFLFLHCNFRLTSWDYIWASAGVYFFAWFARVGIMFLRNGLGHMATFEVLPDRMVKVRIPTQLKWAPGQHYFVRFLDTGVHALTSHPFTVTTLPGSGALEFCIRTRGGMTARLASYAQKQKSSLVLLDGPYGGVHGSLRVYDRVILLAGGSGASFTVPLLSDLVRGFGEGMRCKHVHFVWAVTSAESTSYYEETFEAVLKSAPEGSARISIYVTGASRSSSPSSSTKDDGKLGMAEYAGRPNLQQMVRDACSAGGTVGLASCGPDSFSMDVRNAVAQCELDVTMGLSASSDIFLHTETYSW